MKIKMYIIDEDLSIEMEIEAVGITADLLIEKLDEVINLPYQQPIVIE